MSVHVLQHHSARHLRFTKDAIVGAAMAAAAFGMAVLIVVSA